jgi:predicted regulator of Ras-like GTPase activity (Roadblock/LC7/MglB family)
MVKRSSLNSQLHEGLLTLQAETPGLLGAVLLTAGGLTIVSTLPESVEADVVAAMAAPMLALGERTVEELWQGRLSQVLIKGYEGPYALVEKVNSQVAMVALASREAKLGLVFMNVARTTLAIGRIIDETLQAYPSSVSRKPSAAAIRRLRRLK